MRSLLTDFFCVPTKILTSENGLDWTVTRARTLCEEIDIK